MTPAEIHKFKARHLDMLLAATEEFDGDEEVNGADFVEFFGVWRHEIRLRLEEMTDERIREAESELKHHIVLYLHPDMNQARFPLVFRCEAEDSEHAEEQCVNAEPDAQVVWIHEGFDYDEALAAYWKE